MLSVSSLLLKTQCGDIVGYVLDVIEDPGSVVRIRRPVSADSNQTIRIANTQLV